MKETNVLEWLPNNTEKSIRKYLLILHEISERHNNIRNVLKEIYELELYSKEFDESLIMFTKFVVANFINEKPECIDNFKLSSKEVVNLLINSDINNEEEIIIETKLWAALSEVIFNVISAILEVTLVIYSCHMDKKGIERQVFSYSLNENAKEYKNKIEIMESPRDILSILYSKSLNEKEFISYDKQIDGQIILNKAKILLPTCCCKKYYKESYYREMMRINKKLTKKCMKCSGALNDKVLNSLQDMVESRSIGRIIHITILLVLVIASICFIISRA